MQKIKPGRWSLPVIAALLFVAAGCDSLTEKEGCTDPNALNFDPDAEVDDGSCEFPEGGTEISDDITSDFTFKNNFEDPNAVDYLITKVIDIEADVTIEPGVVIEFSSEAGIEVEANGSLNAVGTPTEKIILRGETATPGFWKEIEFKSNNPNNVFEHVEIAHAGSYSTHYHSSIWLQDNVSTQLAIKNCVIKESKGFGLTAESGTSFPEFENNVFKDNGDAGLRITSNHIVELDEQTVYNDGNGEEYIYVEGDDLTNGGSWPVTSAPYYLDRFMDIETDAKLQPGTSILMGSEAGMDIREQGSLNAIGTSSEPITIKGNIATPGFWRELEFDSNNPLNELEYVEFSHGGSYSTHKYSTIWIQNNVNTRFTMNNCTISDSYGWGLYVESGTDVTPSDKASMEAANTFINNGTGTSANCTGNCSVNDF